jgi:hypothetical protein
MAQKKKLFTLCDCREGRHLHASCISPTSRRGGVFFFFKFF